MPAPGIAKERWKAAKRCGWRARRYAYPVGYPDSRGETAASISDIR